jgi:Ferredoxin-like domain in Api92-like protein
MLTFFFATAWAPPVPLVDYLTAHHPELEFQFAYVSPHAWAGHRRYTGGALIGTGDEGKDEEACLILRRAGWHEAADQLAEWLAEDETDEEA